MVQERASGSLLLVAGLGGLLGGLGGLGGLGALGGLALLHLLFFLECGIGGRGDTTTGDGDVLQEGAELVIGADGQGEGAGADAGGLLAGSLDANLEQLAGQIADDRGGVESCRFGDALGEAALAEEGADAATGEDSAGLHLTGGLLGLGTLLGRDHCWVETFSSCGRRGNNDEKRR